MTNHKRPRMDKINTDFVSHVILTFPFWFQVASAIWYLHDCDIIYRDLKGDNVLVWSLDESTLLNVKLSDYGISCFATPQGVAGEEGTPGYQAPEIRTGVGYDEKVMKEKR